MLERLERIGGSWDEASLQKLAADSAQPEDIRFLSALRLSYIRQAGDGGEERPDQPIRTEETRAALDAAMEQLRRKYE